VLEFHGSRRKAEKEGAFAHEGARWVTADELGKTLNTPHYANAVEQQHYYFLDPARLVAGHVAAAQKAGVALYDLNFARQNKMKDETIWESCYKGR
jgi:glycine/D-amino acid oxidase-like deaminating enzyme